MQSNQRGHHYHHYPNKSERGADEPHIALGDREVPLLSDLHLPLNFARLHNTGIPHHDDPSYEHYQASRAVALSNSVKILESQLSARSPVELLILENDTLTVRYHSQSKLSQQELADLQKATHFDKKELQQWYKGTKVGGGGAERYVGTNSARLFEGLPVWHAHQGGVPEDLQTILSVRGSILICRLCIQRLRRRQIRDYRFQRVHLRPQCH